MICFNLLMIKDEVNEHFIQTQALKYIGKLHKYNTKITIDKNQCIKSCVQIIVKHTTHTNAIPIF